MALTVFNLSDAGIQVATDGEIVRTSPGYAVLDDRTLLTGEAAMGNAKLLPRWTNNRFWSQLSTSPLPNGTEQVRHHADLAFAHLEDLWLPVKNQSEEVILGVPGYYTADNLGLLLGMTNEAGIPVRGVVDHSVVAASNLPLAGNVLHLDIHLHGITLTRLTNSGLLVRRDVKTVIETGFVTLWERWANIIANQFIQATRFDPMHEAATEQKLFDQLPAWIAALEDKAMTPFDLAAGGSTHSVAVSRDNLLTAVSPLYPQIVQAIRQEANDGNPASLLLSHGFSGFPGLRDSLQLIPNLDVIDLGETKLIESITRNKDQIISADGSVAFVTQLDAGESSGSAVASTAAHPTHLLWNHHAYRIGQSFKLGDDFSNGPSAAGTTAATLFVRSGALMLESQSEGIRVNGNAVTEVQQLNKGDEIQLGDQSLTLLTVD